MSRIVTKESLFMPQEGDSVTDLADIVEINLLPNKERSARKWRNTERGLAIANLSLAVVLSGLGLLRVMNSLQTHTPLDGNKVLIDYGFAGLNFFSGAFAAGASEVFEHKRSAIESRRSDLISQLTTRRTTRAIR